MKLKWPKSLRRYLSSHLPRLQSVCKEPKLTHLEFQTFYSSCNLDNSAAAAETVWSIWSLQLSHRQVAVNGNRRESAQLGFYCQNSFPAWLANNKRWQNTFDHLWWPNPTSHPLGKDPVTGIHVRFLLLEPGCWHKVKPSPHVGCSSSSLMGINFENTWGSMLSTCSCLPFTSKSHWCSGLSNVWFVFSSFI